MTDEDVNEIHQALQVLATCNRDDPRHPDAVRTLQRLEPATLPFDRSPQIHKLFVAWALQLGVLEGDLEDYVTQE